MISRVKLIAEPWDVGQADSYSVGAFPDTWSEWNGRYRDTIRAFWSARRACSASWPPGWPGRRTSTGPPVARPHASINFVTCHDGFTLRDLVSYSRKHNEANGEDNRDGTDDNRSWNHGVEGPTDDPDDRGGPCPRRPGDPDDAAAVARASPCCSAATRWAALSGGNNNAYCQDNEVSWFDWVHVDARSPGVRHEGRRDAPRPSGAAAPPLPGRSGVLGLVLPGRRADGRADVAGPAHGSRSRSSSTARWPRTVIRGASPCWITTCSSWSTARQVRSTS